MTLFKALVFFVVICVLVSAYLILDNLGYIRIVKDVADPPPKVIGVVVYLRQNMDAYNGFKKKMEELGFREGKHIEYILEVADGDRDKVDSIIKSFLEKNVDMIYSVSSVPARAALKITNDAGRTDIPVVFAYADEPVKTKLIGSLESSGNNTTGIGISFAEVTAKRVDLLREINPNIKKIGVFLSKISDPAQDSGAAKLRERAKETGLTVVEYILVSPAGPASTEEMKKIAEKIKPGDIDALFRVAGPITGLKDNIFLLMSLGKTLKIPVAAVSVDDLNSGGLFTIAYNVEDAGKKAAESAAKILKGAKPTEIPSEFAKSFIAINLKIASDLGISVPKNILDAAEIKIQ